MGTCSTTRTAWLAAIVFGLGLHTGCGSDDGTEDGTEAEKRGVGSTCRKNEDCTEQGQQCLTNFKGGYCGVKDCDGNAACPAGSGCVTHDDGVNYCFLLCSDKIQCNANRTIDFEANCSSNQTFADGTKGKACVPPSSGT